MFFGIRKILGIKNIFWMSTNFLNVQNQFGFMMAVTDVGISSTWPFLSKMIIQIGPSGVFGGPAENFRKFFEKFPHKSFVCSFARSFENFSKFSSRRRDRFGPKIVKFRAILAIFRPFEDFEFQTAPKRSIWIRFELQGPPKGPAARIEFKCYSLVW